MDTHPRDTVPEAGTNRLFRAIAVIERAGNKLPHRGQSRKEPEHEDRDSSR